MENSSFKGGEEEANSGKLHTGLSNVSLFLVSFLYVCFSNQHNIVQFLKLFFFNLLKLNKGAR